MNNDIKVIETLEENEDLKLFLEAAESENVFLSEKLKEINAEKDNMEKKYEERLAENKVTIDYLEKEVSSRAYKILKVMRKIKNGGK